MGNKIGNNVHCWKQNNIYEIPEIEVFIDKLLNFAIRDFAWYLGNDHEIYKMKETTQYLLKQITQYEICKGIHYENVFQSAEQHVIPKKFDLLSNTSKIYETKFYRYLTCLILSATYICTVSIKYENQKSSQLNQVVKRKKELI